MIGIRERHWLHTDAGSPSFPDDFPDSRAYADLMAAKSLQDARALPKWSTKQRLPVSAFASESVHEEGVYGSVMLPPTGSSTSLGDKGDPHANAVPLDVSYVARTAERLVTYLQASHQMGLLLFPAQTQRMEKFKTLCRRLYEGTVAWHAKSETQGTRAVLRVENVCLLRVSIWPFRKGVVEIGATVYAPTSEDYDTWSCMREKPIMTTAPEGHAHDSSRIVLGFVTSMAPRGSKKAAGIAFCDAVALGLIRGRQWMETTWQKSSEIFLMFCNRGSGTSRPAFASIFLEGGPDM